MKEKNHWRKPYKSDYLSSSDIDELCKDGDDLDIVIKLVKYQECTTQSGKKFCNVAYFNKDVKPMILNVTNAKLVKKFSGNKTYVEEWLNIPVSIYVDPAVKFSGDLVEGLRIRPIQPTMTKPELKKGSDAWNKAVAHIKKGGDTKIITDHYSVDLTKLKADAKT